MTRVRLVSSLVVSLLASFAFAQSTAATISGTVHDEQKSVLPGATVSSEHGNRSSTNRDQRCDRQLQAGRAPTRPLRTRRGTRRDRCSPM